VHRLLVVVLVVLTHNPMEKSGCADWFDFRDISGHPWTWCLRLHGLQDLSIVIGMGYWHAGLCIHPWNLLGVGKMVKGNGFFKSVGI
jgi:hypothetical protein